MSNTRHRSSASDRRGAMLVFIAVCLPLLIIMAAFAVDVAWMQLTRTELRTATDSAARAGAKELSLKQDKKRRPEKGEASRETESRRRRSAQVAEQGCRGRQIGPDRYRTIQFHRRRRQAECRSRNRQENRGFEKRARRLAIRQVLGIDQFEPVETATSTQLDRDICLVVDRSGSMM